MVASEEGSNEALKYCLEGSRRNLIDWGHEYLRSLAGEIGQVYNKRVEENADSDLSDLMFLVDIIVTSIPRRYKHNVTILVQKFFFIVRNGLMEILS